MHDARKRGAEMRHHGVQIVVLDLMGTVRTLPGAVLPRAVLPRAQPRKGKRWIEEVQNRTVCFANVELATAALAVHDRPCRESHVQRATVDFVFFSTIPS